MKRKGIEIKGRFADVPMNLNQVYWEQYKRIVKEEINKGDSLNHLELVISLLGEDRDYWRGLDDVNEYLDLSSMLFTIYQLIKSRTQRDGLKEIIISQYAPKKKRPFWKRRKEAVNSLPVNEIEVDDKVFQAPTDLRWQSTGQYQDALDVTSVIHADTESLHMIEAYERLFKIYFYPIITGEGYEVEKALELDVSKVRYMDVLDFGVFFLIQLNQYQNGIRNRQQKSNIQSMKLKPATMK